MSYGYGPDYAHAAWYIVIMVAFVGLCIFGGFQCRQSECRQVCSANHDQAMQTWTNGCFCRDDDGRLYNPADSR